MTFNVKTYPNLFSNFSDKEKERLKASIKTLNDPFPDSKGDKKHVKGTKSTYRLRVGDYRVFYKFDKVEKTVYVFEILTAEQAHKKYGRC